MTTADLAARVAEADALQQAQIQTTPQSRTIFDLVRDQRNGFAQALPAHVDPDRFVRLACTALRTVPKLAECTPMSILAGLQQAAQLGLEIDAVRGQAYLIPRYNGRTKRMEASFQLGYRGLIDLAGRGGITVSARVVHEHDEFEYIDGLDRVLRHVPDLSGTRGEAIAYYAIARFPDRREPEFVVLGRGDAEQVRDRFAQKNRDGNVQGPWVDHFDAMAMKSTIIRLLNYMPLPVETDAAIRHAIELDAAPEPLDEPLHVDNEAEQPEAIEAAATEVETKAAKK